MDSLRILCRFITKQVRTGYGARIDPVARLDEKWEFPFGSDQYSNFSLISKTPNPNGLTGATCTFERKSRNVINVLAGGGLPKEYG